MKQKYVKRKWHNQLSSYHETHLQQFEVNSLLSNYLNQNEMEGTASFL